MTLVHTQPSLTREGGMLGDPPRLVNVGLSGFAEAPRAHGAEVIDLDWRPPAEGDRELGLLVARLADDPDDAVGAQVMEANAMAMQRLLQARPVLVDVRPAGEVILDDRTLLHAGPPIAWEQMC